ncbi:hypothetical protein AAFF_G00032510 [Aldrovandia affinis]|uniref:Protein kinase domain-containing protein n=1 Tax=Aldrovandia affinis TaxID=143900 RepID=A0AAD7WFX3_9TELE|nr:hypothetical protein AAFF_G00032510 [Aldrovandia affinis]
MSLVNSLAKIYDHKPLHKKPVPAMAATAVGKPGRRPAEAPDTPPAEGFSFIETRIETLSDKMDKLINIQETVLSRLDGMSQDMESLRGDKEEGQPDTGVGGTAEVTGICQEMSTIMSAVDQRSQQQAQKLEGMERLVLGIQQVISFIGEAVKSSRLMEMVFNRPPAARREERPAKPKPTAAARDKPGKFTARDKPTKPAAKETPLKSTVKEKALKSSAKEKATKPESKGKRKRKSLMSKLREIQGRDGKEKSRSSLRGQKSQKKKKPPDTADTVSLKKQALLLEEVQKLNQQNAERRSEPQDPGAGERVEDTSLILDVPRAPVAEQEDSEVEEEEEEEAATQDEEEQEDEEEAEPECEQEAEGEEEEEQLKAEEAEEVEEVEGEEEEGEEEEGEEEEEEAAEEEEERDEGEQITIESPTETEEPAPPDDTSISPVTLECYEEEGGATDSDVTGSEAGAASSKRRVTEELLPQDDHKKSRDASAAVETETEAEPEKEEPSPKEYIIDCSPPPLAPFEHRIVLAKPHQIANFYTINREEILGGGRFGQVHKCVENSSGLTLAAKIIKARSPKEKDIVKNEIQVMNQLSHANLIQLYAAYESRNDIILVMEYVDGGELFDRIIDENYNLTELDTVLFIRQITEGLQYMHQMYILHLDLKPENILCVSRVTNKIKIIDFGLARRYKPREKLRVNFGTPEFLAPEVINYEYVSFPTDMWSLGVITYMLLSGLSPFLGEDDNETLNNILACQWNFEEQEFTDISEEAKDFITRLLVKSKKVRTPPPPTSLELAAHAADGKRAAHIHSHTVGRLIVKLQ